VQPIDAQGLLVTAERLATGAGRPGRPALHDLRRATSTAYYAVFHQIIRHGAFAAFPELEEDEVAFVARWYTHTGVLSAAKSVIKAADHRQPKREEVQRVALLRSARGAIPNPLLDLAERFIELQGQRHEADYSNDYDPVRYATLDHVASAEIAVKNSWSMWRAGSSNRPVRQELWDSYRRFLVLALLDSGGTKVR